MASQSASQASTSFGRLLKSSKVVSQFDASIPLVYTTYGGSKKRSDYGLKRALPKIKTAAIRVHSLDNSMTKLTDFSYAAREHCFVEGFRESNVKVGGHNPGESVPDQRSRLRTAGEAAGGCAWDKKGFQSIEELKSIARGGKDSQKTAAKRNERAQQAFKAIIDSASASTSTASDSAQGEAVTSSSSNQSVTTQSSLQFAPDYVHMSESQFNNFLSKLDRLRPKFFDYLREAGLIEPNPTRQQLKDLYGKVGEVGNWGGIIDDFLARELPAKDPRTGSSLRHDPKLDRLEPSEHFAFGLTYAVPNLYMSDQATRPLPLRYLDTAVAKEAAFGSTGDQLRTPGAPATILGTLTNAARTELPETHTQWQADSQGNYLIEFGSGTARIESASIRHPSTVNRAPTADEVLYGVDVKLVDNPSKKPTIVDQDVVDLKVYKAGNAEGSLKPKRIGSPEWAGTGLSRTTMEDHIRDNNPQALFNVQNQAPERSGYNIRPPMQRRWTGESQIKGRKHSVDSLKDQTSALLATLNHLSDSSKSDTKKSSNTDTRATTSNSGTGTSTSSSNTYGSSKWKK